MVASLFEVLPPITPSLPTLFVLVSIKRDAAGGGWSVVLRDFIVDGDRGSLGVACLCSFLPPMTPNPRDLPCALSDNFSLGFVGEVVVKATLSWSDPESVWSSADCGASVDGEGWGALVCFFPPITPRPPDGFAGLFCLGGGDGSVKGVFPRSSSCPMLVGDFSPLLSCLNLGGVSCR